MMKFTFLFIIIFSSSSWASRGVRCQVFQESLRETEIKREKSARFVLTAQKNRSQYLKTVFTRFEASLDGQDVLVALKNGVGSFKRELKFTGNSKVSETFEFPSNIPGGISNRISINCSK